VGVGAVAPGGQRCLTADLPSLDRARRRGLATPQSTRLVASAPAACGRRESPAAPAPIRRAQPGTSLVAAVLLRAVAGRQRRSRLVPPTHLRVAVRVFTAGAID